MSGLVMITILPFTCLENSMSPSILKDSLARWSILGWKLFWFFVFFFLATQDLGMNVIIYKLDFYHKPSSVILTTI